MVYEGKDHVVEMFNIVSLNWGFGSHVMVVRLNAAVFTHLLKKKGKSLSRSLSLYLCA